MFDDVLLRFTPFLNLLFVYSYLCNVELSNYFPFLYGWNLSEPKGKKYNKYAFIINDQVRLYLYIANYANKRTHRASLKGRSENSV